MESDAYRMCASSARSADMSVVYVLEHLRVRTVDGNESGIHCSEQQWPLDARQAKVFLDC